MKRSAGSLGHFALRRTTFTPHRSLFPRRFNSAKPEDLAPSASVVHRKARPLAGAASAVPLRRRIDRSPVAAERPAHHQPDGTFKNPWPSYTEKGPYEYFTSGMMDLRKLDTYALPRKPVAWDLVAVPQEPLQTLWVGHATFLVQICGWNVLTDPMFSRRASPVQWFGPARYTPPACSLEDLPPLHFVVLSHSHYDHLDEQSVRAILAKEKRDLLRPHPHGSGSRRFTGTLWCVPLRLKSVLECFGVPADSVVELDWWDSFTPALHGPDSSGADGSCSAQQTIVPNALAGIVQRGWHKGTDASAELHAAAPTIVCVPAQHHSARTPFDRNNTLWCGFVLLAPPVPPPAHSQSTSVDSFSAPQGHLRCYFSGDTGYRAVPQGTAAGSAAEASAATCPAFHDIAALYGPVDLALLPIGAYSPRWFMSSFHTTPEDAVELHIAVNARRSVAMHWGTFPLTDEPIEEPPVRLAAACAAKGIPAGEFIAVRAGSLVCAAGGAKRDSADVVESRTPDGDAIAASHAAVTDPDAAKSTLTLWERLRAYL